MMLRIIYVVLIALCAQQALIRSATAAEQGSLAGQPTGMVGLTPLGLAFSVLPPAERRALGVSFGLVVERVDPTADAGPIQRGDVITAINNTEFASLEEFNRIVAKQKPGSSIALLVRRGTDSLYVPVKVMGQQ